MTDSSVLRQLKPPLKPHPMEGRQNTDMEPQVKTSACCHWNRPLPKKAAARARDPSGSFCRAPSGREHWEDQEQPVKAEVLSLSRTFKLPGSAGVFRKNRWHKANLGQCQPSKTQPALNLSCLLLFGMQRENNQQIGKEEQEKREAGPHSPSLDGRAFGAELTSNQV